jgi:hypothetical protein
MSKITLTLATALTMAYSASSQAFLCTDSPEKIINELRQQPLPSQIDGPMKGHHEISLEYLKSAPQVDHFDESSNQLVRQAVQQIEQSGALITSDFSCAQGHSENFFIKLSNGQIYFLPLKLRISKEGSHTP